MRFYIIRHGVTEWNALKKVQGAVDIPLAPEGIRLAKITGEALKDVPFDICFTSPLKRAEETARLVLGEKADRIPVIPDKRIQEIDFGVLEGTRFKDENGKILSEEMKIFFSEPQKFKRPENGASRRVYDLPGRLFGMKKTHQRGEVRLVKLALKCVFPTLFYLDFHQKICLMTSSIVFTYTKVRPFT